ncbi:hypothetical protein NXX31_26360 [Bacteroides thetaiotaomicron]|uniref:hypothetical protein n=1 Tax=Bacteroides thetaiotaomicron TaxID=818 RepID=UPI002164F8D9|nr:hypothetical protein [Bacteroides thetaiotaomicron]MCS3332122.1 hypothetical protein [Bacteroides thetaiotaomicron]
MQLISDVLDLSKIEAGTMEFDYAPVDVHGLFIELEDTFRLRNKKVRHLYLLSPPDDRMCRKGGP